MSQLANPLRHGENLIHVREDPVTGEKVGVATVRFQRFIDSLGDNSSALVEIDGQDTLGAADDTMKRSIMEIESLRETVQDMIDSLTSSVAALDEQIETDTRLTAQLESVKYRVTNVEQLL